MAELSSSRLHHKMFLDLDNSLFLVSAVWEVLFISFDDDKDDNRSSIDIESCFKMDGSCSELTCI